MNKPAHRGFTLIELIVVVLVVALLFGALVPAIQAGRRGSRGKVCMQNVGDIVQTCKVYSMYNSGRWPAVDSWYDMFVTSVEPFSAMGGVAELPRDTLSRNNEEFGTHVAPSRSLWVLVRAGLLPVSTFICPDSGDLLDPTPNIEYFHDFKGYGYLSYGYQVPYYPRHNDSRPHEDRDPRMVLLADKSSMFEVSEQEAVEGRAAPPGSRVAYNSQVDTSVVLNFIGHCPQTIMPGFTDPKAEGLINSPNHGGAGQNVARTDGSVEFVDNPWVGVDSENIYVTHRPPGNANYFFNIMCGAPFGLPGFGVPGYRGLSAVLNSSTDTALAP